MFAYFLNSGILPVTLPSLVYLRSVGSTTWGRGRRKAQTLRRYRTVEGARPTPHSTAPVSVACLVRSDQPDGLQAWPALALPPLLLTPLGQQDADTAIRQARRTRAYSFPRVVSFGKFRESKRRRGIRPQGKLRLHRSP
jgi:hypothetical protein